MGLIGPYGQTSNVQFTANKAISSSTTRCKLFHIFKPKNMVPVHAAQFWVNAVVRIRTEDMIEKVRRSSNISERTKCHLENEFRKRVISLFPVNCYCFCQVNILKYFKDPTDHCLNGSARKNHDFLQKFFDIISNLK